MENVCADEEEAEAAYLAAADKMQKARATARYLNSVDTLCNRLLCVAVRQVQAAKLGMSKRASIGAKRVSKHTSSAGQLDSLDRAKLDQATTRVCNSRW